MSRNRIKRRIDGQPDGRSNPNLKPCPPEKQRLILRECTKDGFKFLGIGDEGEFPTRKNLERYLRREGYRSGTFVLLSARPRPKHFATFQFKRIKSKMGGEKMKLIRIK